MEQSVASSPGNPLWLIFITIPNGLNGSLATGFPSKSEFRILKTMKRTTATTAPDLNLNKERSRLASLRLVSTRSILLVLKLLVDDLVRIGFHSFELLGSLVYGGLERFVGVGTVDEKPGEGLAYDGRAD
ncbi:hypothetical protein HS088_TW03G00987 [Tripterygium wilfordii]|uniref:Uncharacterized protein n=1 Tax=Tripterygium wilfordii TaxID=458696 RepID=A0A7J7DW97_TRIWF|nr:hypothetical protein HS088_TW03G00987 [Tripterygium wilfordii]